MFGTEELTYRADTVRQAWNRSCSLYAKDAIVRYTTADFSQLMDALVPGLLTAMGIVAVGNFGGALVGTAVGACFGPAAMPIGADIGMMIGQALASAALFYLNVKFLSDYILPRAWMIGDHLKKAITLGWDAGGWGQVAQAKLVDQSAREFAEAVGVFCSLLLQAIVLRILKNPLKNASEFANSMIYRSCTGLFAYIIANLQTLIARLPASERPVLATPVAPPVANARTAPPPVQAGRFTHLEIGPPATSLPTARTRNPMGVLAAEGAPFKDFPEFRYKSYSEVTEFLKSHRFDPVKEERLQANGKNANQGGSEIWVRRRLDGTIEAVRLDRAGHDAPPPDQRQGPFTLERDAAGNVQSERTGAGGLGHMHKESFPASRLPEYLRAFLPEAVTYSDNNTALVKPPGRGQPAAPPYDPMLPDARQVSTYYWNKTHIPIVNR